MTAASLAGLVTGCAAFTPIGTARTLDRGKLQFQAAEVTSVFSWHRGGADQRDVLVGGANVEFAASHGVTDRFEVGAKILGTGSTLGCKVALLRAPSPEAGLDLALAPAFGGYGVFSRDGTRSGDQSLITGFLELPLLAGWNVGGGSQLVLSAEVAEVVIGYSVAPDPLHMLWGGGGVGFAWKAREGFRLFPQAAIAAPLVARSGGAALPVHGPLFQVSLGFIVGGD